MNKKITKFFAVLAVLLLLVSSLPVGVFAENASTVKGIVKHEWTLNMLPHPHGEVLIVAPEKLYKGSEVSFTATPDEKYALKSINFYTTDPAIVTDITDSMALTMPDANVNVLVVFEETYSVTFNMMGHGEQVSQQKGLRSGSLAKHPEKPTAGGYTFGGWYKNEEFDEVWNFGDDIVTTDVVLYAKWIKDTVPTSAVGGKVTEDGVNVPDATVELFKGCEKIAATVTDKDGIYAFDNVETGTYNIVVTSKDGKTKTEIVTVTTAAGFSADVELPVSAVSSKVEHTGTEISGTKADIDRTVVGGLEEIAAKQQPQDGEKITVKLTVEPVADTATTEQNAIKEIAKDRYKVEFLDLTLTKQVNDNPPTDIGDTNTDILTVMIPFDFTGVLDGSVEILRYHKGIPERLTENPEAGKEGFKVDKAAGTITVFAYKFSDYAVSYLIETDAPCKHTDADKDHICDKCNERISGHSGVHQDGLAPTESHDGYREYYKCECGRYFEDKDCKTEINDLEAWKAKGGRGYLAKLENSPQTGDTSRLMFWCIIAAGSLSLLILLICKRRKEEAE